jgi:hypothetical protein
MVTMMNFSEAYKLPIGEHVEKKGKFSYLSWPYAVRFLRENFPGAVWNIHENQDGLPIFSIGSSHMVKVSVVLDGQVFTQWHPILNSNNKPIQEPSTFEINTSIQRALAKAIGIATGIGLGLYAGEDLPTENGDDQKDDDTHGAKQLEVYDKARDAIELMCDKDAKNRKGEPMTREAFIWWYENIPEINAMKKKLNAQNLSLLNSHFQQCLNTFYPMKIAA